MSESNALNPETVRNYVSQIEACDSEILSERGEFMAACRAIRNRKKEFFEHARDDGIDVLGLKFELKRRKKEREFEDLVADEEPEVVETADMVREALGDFGFTPLGEAAANVAGTLAEKLAAKAEAKAAEKREKAAAKKAAKAAAPAIDDTPPPPEPQQTQADEVDLRPAFMINSDEHAPPA